MTETRRPWLWLAIAGVVAVVGIAVLWPLRTVGQVCILIYPPPPGCGSPVPQFAAIGGIALIVVLLTAITVVWFVSPAPRAIIIALSAGIVAVTMLAAVLVALSQTGIWDPPVLPIQ